MAHHGTIFLDEIGELPLPLQAKILRALEERQFERVGGTTSLHVDVRVVAATNRNLKASVAARQFREDLYFRLSVFPIVIPPLRERADDIPILARNFVEKFCREMNKPTLALSPSALDDLRAYPWPGNVRELQNCIERAVILCDTDAVHSRHLNLSFRDAAPPPAVNPWDHFDLSGTMAAALGRVTAEVERRKVEMALRDAGGDRVRAADQLQIPLKVLVAKIKEFGLA
jgi:transcriptional regulator with GAF, ATPase, and Fis domain